MEILNKVIETAEAYQGIILIIVLILLVLVVVWVWLMVGLENYRFTLLKDLISSQDHHKSLKEKYDEKVNSIDLDLDLNKEKQLEFDNLVMDFKKNMKRLGEDINDEDVREIIEEAGAENK